MANKKKGMFRRFAAFYKPHTKLFAIDMCCAFIISVFNLAYPYLTKEIINNYVPNKLLNYLLIGTSALLVMYGIKAGLNYVLQYWGHLVGTRIQKDMRKQLFEHLQGMPFKYFDDNKTGVIMSRMTNDLFEISELAHHGPEDVFLSLVTIIGAFILLSFTNVYLALIVFALVPLSMIFILLMRRRQQRVYKEVRVATGEFTADIESSLSGIRVSRAYAAEEHEKERFESFNAALAGAKGKQYKVMGEFHSVTTFFLDILYFTVLLAGGLFFYYGKIDVGEFTAFVLYISVLITPVRTMRDIYDNIKDGTTGFARFCEIMDESCEEQAENAIRPDTIKGDIVFDNVDFSYGEKDVLHNFSMRVGAGKTVALVGPSGGGKTTVCHLIPRFYDICGGKITIDGNDLSQIDLHTLRKNVGIVQQDVFLFNGTIKENIAYGDFEADDERIIEAARLANIDEYIRSLPDGYDTCVGERGIKLSGGQKQRVAIARAFLKNPPVIILDEATSALDNATEMQIQQALSKLAEGRTTIVVAHRLSTVKNADEILVVDGGKIIERGTHSELLKKGGLYCDYYNYQFRENG